MLIIFVLYSLQQPLFSFSVLKGKQKGKHLVLSPTATFFTVKNHASSLGNGDRTKQTKHLQCPFTSYLPFLGTIDNPGLHKYSVCSAEVFKHVVSQYLLHSSNKRFTHKLGWDLGYNLLHGLFKIS